MNITFYPCDTIHVDRINGRYEAYTYGDGTRHFIMSSGNISIIERYAKRYHYKIVMLNTK
jgi:hypothetical protein